MLSIVQASGAVFNLHNSPTYSEAIPHLAPALTHHAITIAQQNATGHQLVQDMSNSTLLAPIGLHSRSGVHKMSSFTEYGQHVLSFSMFHRHRSLTNVLCAYSQALSKLVCAAICSGLLLWVMTLCTHHYGFRGASFPGQHEEPETEPEGGACSSRALPSGGGQEIEQSDAEREEVACSSWDVPQVRRHWFEFWHKNDSLGCAVGRADNDASAQHGAAPSDTESSEGDTRALVSSWPGLRRTWPACNS